MNDRTTRRTVVASTLAILGGGALARALAQPATPGATPDASPAASPGASPMASPATGAEVRISEYKFVPQDLEITVGTTVTWVQDDIIGHTATASDGSFTSEVLGRGESYTHTFDAAGTIPYICALHPGMTGTVTVR